MTRYETFSMGGVMTEVLNLMHQDSPIQPTITKIYLIPEWAITALRRNKFSPKDILNYGKVRKVFSISDLAKIVALNYLAVSREGDIPVGFRHARFLEQSSYSYEVLRKSAVDKDLYTEFQNAICPLAQTKEILDSVIADVSLDAPLYRTPNDEPIVVSDYFEIVQVDTEQIIIVLKKGFKTVIEDRDAAKAFISAFLKTQYTYQPLSKVSLTPAFLDYVKLL